MNKQEIYEEVVRIREIISDFNLMKHLFSDDKAERTLAELNVNTTNLLRLIKLSELKEVKPPSNKAIERDYMHREPHLVKIRPCAEQYDNKTFLGLYLGEIALSVSIGIEENKIHCNFASHNPAIYIPEIGKIIYGCESWWGAIKNPEELKNISDKDIQNVWYVKAMAATLEQRKESKT